jgi:uncharacterized protein (TIGR03437 family)
VDAPQTITVTVQVGHVVPSSFDVSVAPCGSASVPIVNLIFGGMADTIQTQDGANWLSLDLSITDAGTFEYFDYTAVVTPQPSNTAGNTYTGWITTNLINTPIFTVTMNVTAPPGGYGPQPIACAYPAKVTEQLEAGAVDYVDVILSNPGSGALAISGVSTTGSWLTASASGATVQLGFDATGLSPNTYTGSVRIASNASNSPTAVPVTFQVVPAGPPVISAVLDNTLFGGGPLGATVSPGDIVALFGQQLSFDGPSVGPAPPLAMQLGGASVFVNGEQAPLYYSSSRQIDFQMPMDTALGTAQVQVSANGWTSASAPIRVDSMAPELLLLDGTGGYGVIVDASQGNGYNVLPLPSNIMIPGFISQPAKPGDVLTIYAVGLGPTNPSVASGQPSPDGIGAPLAWLTIIPSVNFFLSEGRELVVATPSYAGLAPYFAGLYQINVTIPANCPTGTVYLLLSYPDSPGSNAVYIQVQ